MHLGIARTLLAAWLDARKNGGQIGMRVEDIDTPRAVPGATQAIFDDLAWMGLHWEGEPVFQSARSGAYEAAIAQLSAQGRVYPCTCTRKEIVASAPHGPGDEGPRYPGTCRDPARRVAGRPAALRLETRPGDVVAHTDAIYGDASQDVHAAVGDFILRRSDGLWAYQLAVTVDDLAQDVTHIVRGADLLPSTARQILLRNLLDPAANPLRTLHVPLIRGPDGRRLAKRDGDAGIATRRQNGERPEALVGFLASSLGLVPAGTELTARALVEHWNPAAISTRDVLF